jgi:hypothetical protein
MRSGGGRIAAEDERENALIYEMRVYRCLPNRMPALLRRFRDHTLKIWDRHGIKQAGFWTTVVGESASDLTYLVAWESLAEREVCTGIRRRLFCA